MTWNATGWSRSAADTVEWEVAGNLRGVCAVKKGRHRRFEEARALKRTSIDLEDLLGGAPEPCPECGCEPGDEHASWCRFEETEDTDD
jgi:hypothetical protein